MWLKAYDIFFQILIARVCIKTHTVFQLLCLCARARVKIVPSSANSNESVYSSNEMGYKSLLLNKLLVDQNEAAYVQSCDE